MTYKLSPEEVLSACRDWLQKRTAEYSESDEIKVSVHAMIDSKRLHVEGVEIAFECSGQPYR